MLVTKATPVAGGLVASDRTLKCPNFPTSHPNKRFGFKVRSRRSMRNVVGTTVCCGCAVAGATKAVNAATLWNSDVKVSDQAVTVREPQKHVHSPTYGHFTPHMLLLPPVFRYQPTKHKRRISDFSIVFTVQRISSRTPATCTIPQRSCYRYLGNPFHVVTA